MDIKVHLTTAIVSIIGDSVPLVRGRTSLVCRRTFEQEEGVVRTWFPGGRDLPILASGT